MSRRRARIGEAASWRVRRRRRGRVPSLEMVVDGDGLRRIVLFLAGSPPALVSRREKRSDGLGVSAGEGRGEAMVGRRVSARKTGNESSLAGSARA